MLLALAVRFRLLHRPLEPALTDPREHRRGGHRHGRERGPCRLSLRGRGPLPVAGAAQDTSAVTASGTADWPDIVVLEPRERAQRLSIAGSCPDIVALGALASFLCERA